METVLEGPNLRHSCHEQFMLPIFSGFYRFSRGFTFLSPLAIHTLLTSLLCSILHMRPKHPNYCSLFSICCAIGFTRSSSVTTWFLILYLQVILNLSKILHFYCLQLAFHLFISDPCFGFYADFPFIEGWPHCKIQFFRFFYLALNFMMPISVSADCYS